MSHAEYSDFLRNLSEASQVRIVSFVKTVIDHLTSPDPVETDRHHLRQEFSALQENLGSKAVDVTKDEIKARLIDHLVAKGFEPERAQRKSTDLLKLLENVH